MKWVRLRAGLSLALAQLRFHNVRTSLAVLGVTLAVLTSVLLAALAISVVSSGGAGFETIGADVWVAAESVSFAPGAVGSVTTDLQNSHEIATDIEARDDVAAARAIHFQTVYVGTEAGQYETIVGTGVTGGGASLNTDAGRTFDSPDEHYAAGEYNGPMSNEVIIDRRLARQLNVSIGENIHVGGTVSAADQHTFTVVGTTNDITRFIGVPTVILHLSELQEISATTQTDPATAIIIASEDGSDAALVRDDLRATYPQLTVRTADEQFRAVLQRQSIVMGSTAAIGFLAVAIGIALVVNVFGLLVYQQRRHLAALKACGISTSTLLTSVLLQGAVVGILGGSIGAGLAFPSRMILNRVIVRLIGYDGLITVPLWLPLTGVMLAVTVGILGALLAARIVIRVQPSRHLQE